MKRRSRQLPRRPRATLPTVACYCPPGCARKCSRSSCATRPPMVTRASSSNSRLPIQVQVGKRVRPTSVFAAAVAGYGMLLRHSDYSGQVTWSSVAEWAHEGLGSDGQRLPYGIPQLAGKGEGIGAVIAGASRSLCHPERSRRTPSLYRVVAGCSMWQCGSRTTSISAMVAGSVTGSFDFVTLRSG